MSIDPKIKEAIKTIGEMSTLGLPYDLAMAISRVMDAYVAAEARARDLEHKRDCRINTYGVCNDPRHKRTLKEWVTEVESELKDD